MSSVPTENLADGSAKVVCVQANCQLLTFAHGPDRNPYEDTSPMRQCAPTPTLWVTGAPA